MTQRRQNRSNVEQVDVDKDAIKECIRYIVCREGSKIPIKRADIVKHLASTCQIPSASSNAVIVEANKELKRIYGYKLVQVDAKSGIHYIVVLTEPCESLPSCATNPLHKRILVAALTHIFMSGGSVKEEEMWKFLEEANLLEEHDHPGRKLLTTTYSRQMYLIYSKVGDGDLARNVFQWGQRAVEEIPKIFLLQKVADALGRSPDHWCEQYREATGSLS